MLHILRFVIFPSEMSFLFYFLEKGNLILQFCMLEYLFLRPQKSLGTKLTSFERNSSGVVSHFYLTNVLITVEF